MHSFGLKNKTTQSTFTLTFLEKFKSKTMATFYTNIRKTSGLTKSGLIAKIDQ